MLMTQFVLSLPNIIKIKGNEQNTIRYSVRHHITLCLQ